MHDLEWRDVRISCNGVLLVSSSFRKLRATFGIWPGQRRRHCQQLRCYHPELVKMTNSTSPPLQALSNLALPPLREACTYQNGWIFGKVPNGLWPPPLIFGKSCCRFFKKLYSLKNHTCGIFLKSPGYESIKNNDPCCQIQSYFFWVTLLSWSRCFTKAR